MCPLTFLAFRTSRQSNFGRNNNTHNLWGHNSSCGIGLPPEVGLLGPAQVSPGGGRAEWQMTGTDDEKDRGVVWATGCPEGFGSDPHLRRSPPGELGPARARVKMLQSEPGVDSPRSGALQQPGAAQQTPHHTIATRLLQPLRLVET